MSMVRFITSKLPSLGTTVSSLDGSTRSSALAVSSGGVIERLVSNNAVVLRHIRLNHSVVARGSVSVGS